MKKKIEKNLKKCLTTFQNYDIIRMQTKTKQNTRKVVDDYDKDDYC